MTTLPSVLSPVASYEATGVLAWRPRRTPANCLQRRYVARLQPSPPSNVVSHDFSPLPPPSSRRRRPAAFAILLPLSMTVSACGDADIGYLVLPLPASIAVLVGAGLVFLLAGIGIGVLLALAYLRAADRAADQYHRAEIARVLSASSTVHASVQEVLAIVHRRTQELQRLVAVLQKGGAK